MEWLKNVLQWVNDNYSLLIVILALIISIYRKTKVFLSKSEEEQISLIKNEIQSRILKMVSDAEEDYSDWSKAGKIKRSQVISEIYTEYPELSMLIGKEEFIEWIDNEIDTALITLREVLNANK
jgi:hypothetical protein